MLVGYVVYSDSIYEKIYKFVGDFKVDGILDNLYNLKGCFG